MVKLLEFTGTSQSKAKAWLQCRQAYHFKYVMGVIRKRVRRPFKFGTIVHKMLEAHANGDDPFEVLDTIAAKDFKLFKEEVEEYGDIIEDIRNIMTDYFNQWPDDSLRYVRRKGRGAEHEFEVVLSNGVKFKGTIDGVARTPDKRTWLIEHKTFKGEKPRDQWRNLQSGVYIRAVQMLGWVGIDGTLWDYVCSKPPGTPAVLKSGELSKARLYTLPTALQKFLKRSKLNPKDYPELVASARENTNDAFQRIKNPRKEHVITALFDEFTDIAGEMRDRHGKAKHKNIGQWCSWCDYEPLCRAELQQDDVDMLLEREYVFEQDVVKRDTAPRDDT